MTVDRGPVGSAHFWIALQDVTVERGCMQFIPESHRGALRPHRRLRETAHAMEAIDVDPATAVACPLRAGGATVHLPRTLHCRGPNLTDEPRLAWAVEFGPAHLWRRPTSPLAIARASSRWLGKVAPLVFRPRRG